MRAALRIVSLAVLSAAPAFAAADEVEDVVKLAKAGVAEETILSFIEASKGGFQLSADRVLELKRENVPERVIAAMLRRRSGTAAKSPPPAGRAAGPDAAPTAVGAEDISGKATRAEEPAGEVAVRIENAGGADLYVAADAESRIAYISTGAGEGKLPAGRGASAFLRLKRGRCEVRWEGADSGIAFEARGASIMIIVSRAAAGEVEAFYASVYDGDEKKAGGRLALVRGGRLAEDGKSDAGPAAPGGTGRAAGGGGIGGYRSEPSGDRRDGSAGGDSKDANRDAGERKGEDKKDRRGEQGGETPPPERIGWGMPAELEVRLVPRSPYCFAAVPCIRPYAWYPCPVLPSAYVWIGPYLRIGSFCHAPSLNASYFRASRRGWLRLDLRL